MGRAPATYNKGKDPIGEFFCSKALRIDKCGFLSYGTNTGDHCPIWVDLTKESALGINPPKVTSFQARRLKTTDPRTVQKYSTVLEEEFQKHRIYKRASDLYDAFGSNLTPEQCAEFDAIDRIRSKSMKKAEKKCRKLFMGAVPWSPVLQKARKLILCIKLVI